MLTSNQLYFFKELWVISLLVVGFVCLIDCVVTALEYSIKLMHFVNYVLLVYEWHILLNLCFSFLKRVVTLLLPIKNACKLDNCRSGNFSTNICLLPLELELWNPYVGGMKVPQKERDSPFGSQGPAKFQAINSQLLPAAAHSGAPGYLFDWLIHWFISYAAHLALRVITAQWNENIKCSYKYGSKVTKIKQRNFKRKKCWLESRPFRECCHLLPSSPSYFLGIFLQESEPQGSLSKSSLREAWGS